MKVKEEVVEESPPDSIVQDEIYEQKKRAQSRNQDATTSSSTDAVTHSHASATSLNEIGQLNEPLASLKIEDCKFTASTSKSPPASHLLRRQLVPRPSQAFVGSVAESLLTGRMSATPKSYCDGFTLTLSVNGRKAVDSVSPQRLPMSTVVYTGAENILTPYVGVANSDKSSFKVPSSGTMVLVVSNPNETPVQFYQLPYDLSKMQVGTKTFLRQTIMDGNRLVCTTQVWFACVKGPRAQPAQQSSMLTADGVYQLNSPIDHMATGSSIDSEFSDCGSLPSGGGFFPRSFQATIGSPASCCSDLSDREGMARGRQKRKRLIFLFKEIKCCFSHRLPDEEERSLFTTLVEGPGVEATYFPLTSEEKKALEPSVAALSNSGSVGRSSTPLMLTPNASCSLGADRPMSPEEPAGSSSIASRSHSPSRHCASNEVENPTADGNGVAAVTIEPSFRQRSMASSPRSCPSIVHDELPPNRYVRESSR